MNRHARYRAELEHGAAGVLFFIVCGVLGWLAGLAIAAGHL